MRLANKATRHLMLIVALLFAASLSGCVSETTHKKEMEEQRQRYESQLKDQESRHHQETAAMHEEIAALKQELQHTRDKAKKAIEIARWEGFGLQERGLLPLNTIEPSAPILEALAQSGIAAGLILLLTGLACLVWDRAVVPMLVNFLNIPVGMFLFFRLTGASVSALNFRQVIQHQTILQLVLPVTGFLLAAVFARVARSKRPLWLHAGAIVITTMAALQWAVWAFTADEMVAVLGPAQALKLMASPLIGVALWFIVHISYKKSQAARAQSEDPIGPTNPKPAPPSIVQPDDVQPDDFIDAIPVFEDVFTGVFRAPEATKNGR